jgi:hypothetical protein
MREVTSLQNLLRFIVVAASVAVLLLLLNILYIAPPLLAFRSDVEYAINAGIVGLLKQPSPFIFAWMALISIVFGYCLHFGLIWLHERRRPETHANAVPPEVDAARELLGHFLGVIGVVYAVLLAFVVVSAWQEEDHTEEVSLQEEQATWATYALVRSYDYSKQDSTALRTLLTPRSGLFWSYIDGMSVEWASMRKDDSEQSKIFRTNGRIATSIRDQVLSLHPSAKRDEFIYNAAIQSSSALVAARYHRLHHYTDLSVDTIMWLTLFFGGIITLVVPYVGTQVPPHQLIRTVALSTMIGIMFMLALIFDYPFTGYNAIPATQWERLHSILTRSDAVKKHLQTVRQN